MRSGKRWHKLPEQIPKRREKARFVSMQNWCLTPKKRAHSHTKAHLYMGHRNHDEATVRLTLARRTGPMSLRRRLPSRALIASRYTRRSLSRGPGADYWPARRGEIIRRPELFLLSLLSCWYTRSRAPSALVDACASVAAS